MPDLGHVRIIIFILFSSYYFSQGQNVLNFCKPLDITPVITGSFGEPRPDHIHSGIDYSTNGKEGLDVYAIDTGYVSRIKVSSVGYGRVIYITHPSGYTSVYAHLNEFGVLINDYVIRKQYEAQKFEIDINPDPRLFAVSKKDVIGYSGNTGRSTGPHLHFEVRTSKTERPLNPWLFGFTTPDSRPPTPYRLKLYPIGQGSSVEYSDFPKEYVVSGRNNLYSLKVPDTLCVCGQIALGVMVDDNTNNTSNTIGIYSIVVSIDGNTRFIMKADSFAFDESRDVNALIDYPEYIKTHRRFFQTRIAPGNRLSFYPDDFERGMFAIHDTISHKFEMRLSDAAGNESIVLFYAKCDRRNNSISKEIKNSDPLCYYGLRYEFMNDYARVNIPPNAFNDSVYFHFGVSGKRKNTWSQTIQLHDPLVPLQSPIILGIIPDSSLPHSKRGKIVMVCADGKTLSSVGGKWDDEYFSAAIRKLGTYFLADDTEAPVIKPLNIYDGKTVSAQNDLSVICTDNLSGIASYNAWLNEEWVLLEYDEKKNLFFYTIDNHMKSGRNIFRIEIIDETGNLASQIFNLHY